MRDTKKPRGLTLRGNMWWINIDRRGVKIRESTGCVAADLAGAIAVRDRRIEEATGRLAVVTTSQPSGERTFGDAAFEYVANLERRGKDATRAIQDIKMILGEVGDWPLSHIHQTTLQPWIDAQQGKRSSGTVGRALRTIVTVLRYAAFVGRDGHEPWLKVAPPKILAPDWGARERRPLTWEEQDRLVAELPEHLVAPVLWALHTGARQQEITTLRWDQHRPVEGLPQWSAWWIPPEVRKASSRAKVSERDGRYIVCGRAARAVVAGQVGRSACWVFPSPKRNEALYRINNHGWRAACKRAGLDIREHDLRHTFGDRAADAGIPEEIVAVLLGHRRRGITAHYSRPGLVRLVQEVEQIVRPEPCLRVAV